MIIDTIGLRCPEPLMIVRKKLRSLEDNKSLEIIADDPSTERDFTLLCNFLHYKLEIIDISNGIYRYKITKTISS